MPAYSQERFASVPAMTAASSAAVQISPLLPRYSSAAFQVEQRSSAAEPRPFAVVRRSFAVRFP